MLVVNVRAVRSWWRVMPRKEEATGCALTWHFWESDRGIRNEHGRESSSGAVVSLEVEADGERFVDGGGAEAEADRVMAGSAVGGMVLRVELSPWRWALRWPREVASARGGLESTRVGVSRGVEERKPERMAKRKVDVEGEPKHRWV